MHNNPLVTIVIVSWNSEKFLPLCLERLSKQTIQDFEIILVNNGPKSYFLDNLTSENLRLIDLNENKGFALANNIGARAASGKWLAFLNTDAFPEPDWLERLLYAAEKNPTYDSFASRQIQYHFSDLLDGAGDVYHITGLAWRRYYNRSAKEFGMLAGEVFSACPAASLYSKDKFLDIGGFDEDYFSYFEDVDLGFRFQINGSKCLYVPDAIAYHVGSASTGKRSDFSVYYSYRNMIWTFFKNMPSPYLGLFFPFHFLAVLFFFFYLFLRGQGNAISRAIVDALYGLPKILNKRKAIQQGRKIALSRLMKVMSIGIFEPYAEFMIRNRNKNEE